MQSGGKCFKHIFCQFLLFFIIFSFAVSFWSCCCFCTAALVLFVCSLPQVKTATQRDMPVCVCVSVCLCQCALLSQWFQAQRTRNAQHGRQMVVCFWNNICVEASLSFPHFFAGISKRVLVCVCVCVCEWSNGAMFDLHCKSWQFCKMSSYIRNNMFYLLTFDFDFADSLPTVCTKAWEEWVLFPSLALFYLRLRGNVRI